MGQEYTDAMNLIQRILNEQFDKAKQTDYINQLILIAQTGDIQAQWYLGSLLRQVSQKYRATQQIAIQLFQTHRERIDTQYEEAHIRIAQIKKDIEDANQHLKELQFMQQADEINRKWETKESLDDYKLKVENIETEIITLKRQLQELVQQIVGGEGKSA